MKMITNTLLSLKLAREYVLPSVPGREKSCAGLPKGTIVEYVKAIANFPTIYVLSRTVLEVERQVNANTIYGKSKDQPPGNPEKDKRNNWREWTG